MRPLDDLPKEEWKREVARIVMQHHADIQRLLQGQDTRPDDYVGRPPGLQAAFQTTGTTTEE